MITTIIFSKNRPLQLDLCLQSLKRFNTGTKPDVVVIYDCDDEYEGAYRELQNEYRTSVIGQFSFWKQGPSLFKDVKLAIESSDHGLICFLTDDSFFYRETLVMDKEFLDLVFSNAVCSIALRLGGNINRRATGRKEEPWIPNPFHWLENLAISAIANHDCYVYNRTQHLLSSYWNYPQTLDGSIFPKEDILEWVTELHYLEPLKKWVQTPNGIETGLQRFVGLAKPLIVFPTQSCVVNSPNNMVQSDFMNRSGEYFPLKEHDLLEMFESNIRIDLDKLVTPAIFCPHQEIDILQGWK
tara:strand:+ start:3019 stop:3912 length:894 start_codon:yes stop_codon:yes gene_type:complete